MTGTHRAKGEGVPQAIASTGAVAGRLRIDWMPGPAAAEALAIAQTLLPRISRQALIDRLVITGLHALRQPPAPQLWGDDRDTWRLPDELRLHGLDRAAPSAFPGK